MDLDARTLEDYVRSALALNGYALDEECSAAVLLQFARIATIAAAVLDEPLSPTTEPLPVFRP